MSDISVDGRLQLIGELRCGYSPERGDDDLLLFADALTVIAAATVIMAWELAEANDVRFRDCTPEERWERVLNWVRDRIDRHPLEEAPE